MRSLPTVEFPPFQPHRLVSGANAQTIVGSFSRRESGALEASAERRIVRTDAETSVRVELDRPQGEPRSALVILHGLGGSSESVYLLGTAHKAVSRGMLVARLNARNCGGTAALTSAPYNGEETADILAVARELHERDGLQKIHLAGFSVGGNQTLRLAAELSTAPPDWLASVSVISPCIDFAAASDGLQQGLFRRSVQRHFLDGLRAIIRERAAVDPSIDITDLDKVSSIRAFDDRYTAPLSGYRDAAEYYAHASMRGRLKELRIPTLVVTSRDDPLVPVEAFETEELGTAPIRLELTPEGGHVGFIGRSPAERGDWRDLDRRWAENRIVQFALASEAL